jgi:hypothetical protein
MRSPNRENVGRIGASSSQASKKTLADRLGTFPICCGWCHCVSILIAVYSTSQTLLRSHPTCNALLAGCLSLPLSKMANAPHPYVLHLGSEDTCVLFSLALIGSLLQPPGARRTISRSRTNHDAPSAYGQLTSVAWPARAYHGQPGTARLVASQYRQAAPRLVEDMLLLRASCSDRQRARRRLRNRRSMPCRSGSENRHVPGPRVSCIWLKRR